VSEGVPTSILVVDDDEDVRALVALQLQLSGPRVREASTVDSGLTAIVMDPPNTVLADLSFGADSGERIILGKPFTMTELAEVVEAGLSGMKREST
jgi:DNA-binding response OmpR family regulator